MAIAVRLILLIVPVLALISFLRYRALVLKDETLLQAELKRLRNRLLILLLVFAAAIGSYMTMDPTGEAGSCYVPPKTVDGQVQKGYFVPFDDPRCPAKAPG